MKPICSQNYLELSTISRIGEHTILSSRQNGISLITSTYGSKYSDLHAMNHSSQKLRQSAPSLLPVPTSASQIEQWARLVTARQVSSTLGLAFFLIIDTFVRIGLVSF